MSYWETSCADVWRLSEKKQLEGTHTVDERQEFSFPISQGQRCALSALSQRAEMKSKEETGNMFVPSISL